MSRYFGSGEALIQGTDGNFYGTTFSGGSAERGTVFKMTSDYVVTTLHEFVSEVDGALPGGALVQGPNGNLYGVTQAGGTGKSGIVFEISTDGSSYIVLHNFADGSVPNDGKDPVCTLILASDNNFYRTTPTGGTHDLGTIFRITP
ncbi:MAG: hypothetical protein JO170_24565 [Verrucomicrobia bacterium]|nr:hypothetical protein [Verrucomicrobiota bacterium]